MRPRTKVNMPEPSGTEFQNFDRFMCILITKKPTKHAKTPASDSPKVQERERLPRP